MLNSTEAVSYTHLDVYKRQLMHRDDIREACGHETVVIDTPSGRPCLVFTENARLKDFEQMARDKRTSNPLYNMHAAGPILAPVSYTHLDVYKRQVLE